MAELKRNMKLDYIKIDDIKLNNFNVNQIEYGIFEDLENSIMKNGVIKPLLVRPYEGKFEIIDGQHRLLIIQEKQKEFISKFGKKIPCIISDVNQKDAEKMVFLFTHTRGDYNQKKASDIFSEREKELSDFTGISVMKLFSYVDPPLIFTQENEISNYHPFLTYKVNISSDFLNIGFLTKYILRNRRGIKDININTKNKILLSCLLSVIINREFKEMDDSKEYENEIMDKVFNEIRLHEITEANLMEGMRLKIYSERMPLKIFKIDNISRGASCRICKIRKNRYYKELYTNKIDGDKGYFCYGCYKKLRERRKTINKNINDFKIINENSRKNFTYKNSMVIN